VKGDIRLGIISNEHHRLAFATIRRVRDQALRILKRIFSTVVFIKPEIHRMTCHIADLGCCRCIGPAVSIIG